MKLISPKGVVVSVSDQKAERLLRQGYRKAGEAPKEETTQPAPKRRGRPKKTES